MVGPCGPDPGGSVKGDGTTEVMPGPQVFGLGDGKKVSSMTEIIHDLLSNERQHPVKGAPLRSEPNGYLYSLRRVLVQASVTPSPGVLVK